MLFPKSILGLSFLLTMLFVSTCYSQMTNYPKLDSLEAAAFLDSVITKAIEESSAPGIGVVIVKDDSIFFSRGYGYSDIENQKPVEPAKTLFRIASVSKVVNGTVILIARDNGLVDLHTDVNEYLTTFSIPEKFNQPITLHNLMTHTPGFDDVYIGKSSRTKEDALPLGDFLKVILPERVMPPGEIFSYSNIGNALAAYVIEERVQKDFELYAVKNLFKPLDMNTSSFTLQEFQKENLYKGYYKDEDRFIEFPFDHINDYPAGQMLTTLDEFANFMIMHLNHGKYKGNTIIDSSSVNEMHSVQFTHHPKLIGGSGYTFAIGDVNGYKNLAHGGGYAGISTLMFLFPELKLGIFTAANTSSYLPGEICNSFMNKFFPPKDTLSKTEYPLTDIPGHDKNVDKFTGKYRDTRYSRNSILKIALLPNFIGYEMPIWKNSEGMLVMFDHKGEERRLIQIEPLLFQSIDDDYYMAFREDGNGKITNVFTSGTNALERINWYETIGFNRSLLLICVLIMLLSITIFYVYKLFRRKGTKKSVNQFLLKASVNVSGTFLIYFGLWGLIMGLMLDPIEQQTGFGYGFPWYVYIVQIIPFIGIIFTVLLIWKMFIAVKILSKAKLGFSVSLIVLIASIGLIWFIHYWNLLGWRF